MDRLKKFIGMILIFGIVFFIVCDEKGYQIGLENNHVDFYKISEKSDSSDSEDRLKNSELNEGNVVYKNSNLIRVNREFKSSKILQKSNKEDTKYLAKFEKQKNTEKEKNNEEILRTGSNILKSNSKDTISSVFQLSDNQDEEKAIDNNQDEIYPIVLYKNSNRIKIYSGFKDPISMRKGSGINNELLIDSDSNSIQDYKEEDNVDYEEEDNVDLQIKNIGSISIESGNMYNNQTRNETKIEGGVYDINKTNDENLEQKEEESKSSLLKIEKYQLKAYPIKLRKGVAIDHDFFIESEYNTGILMSDSMLQDLLENEEIDFNTIETENDEFLQNVFEKTKDINVMNLIVETYLNEYQFIKAKKFIDNLPASYLDKLKPSLNLRVAFNSFPLGSSTIYNNLETLIQNYVSENKISDEDKYRYMGVLALMSQNYDQFFEIAKKFGSEKNKSFVLKIQGYKDQISKQMGMPDYYFDTLVSFELFNQGLFQPAKVLALYSLQNNPKYILPYQILAYANFLTNSRDSSTEYLKKLIDLDHNNAEKYRFLIGVAFYRNEKYEQSVVMLSTIKDDKMRLDAQRYLINDYLKLDQKNKLISSWNRLLGSNNLVASDFYTYFYETFFNPYSQGEEFQLYAFDTELANKMLRVCSITLQNEEKAVCTYGTIGRNIAMGQFDGLEQYLLDLVAEYPQGYLYQALGDYYIKQGDLEKAKLYLLKAISLTQNTSERSQIRKLLQETI